jgi:hypothetical protein
MFDYLNSLIGHAVQQPAPQHIQSTSAVAHLVADDPNAPAQIVTTKALVITYNPTMDAAAGKKLTDLEGWSSPDVLINGYIAGLLQASNGMARHQVVQNIVLDEFPVLADGFRYTPQTFLSVLNGSTPMHNPSGIDYNAILTRFNILQRVANNEIDEVWIMAFPYAGLYESIMAGAGAFWCNAPALANTSSCNRRFVIMGFNYQRGVGEMLHSYAHRAESIMAQVFNCQDFLAWAYNPNRSPATVAAGQTLNLFQRFILYNQIAPGQAGIGLVHFAPNSTKAYEWGNQTPVNSTCDDWLAFPNLTGATRNVNCNEWGGGDDRSYQTWWLNHLPKVAGIKNGISNNWWYYIANPNNVRV